jgi:hypothetical protein
MGFAPSLRIWWLSLLACIVLASVARADDDLSADALRAGRSALQFEIDDGFFISGFEGTTLSFKRMVSARAAWRIGVTYGGAAFDREELSQDVVDTVLVTYADFDGSDSNFGVGLSILHMRYVGGRGRVRPFVGFGPFVGYNHDEGEESGVFFVPFAVHRRREDESSRVRIGARALFGTEVFVSKSVSILGQFSTSIAHSHYENSYSVVDSAPQIPPGERRGFHDERSSDGWEFGDNRVSLGLSAYF